MDELELIERSSKAKIYEASSRDYHNALEFPIATRCDSSLNLLRRNALAKLR